MIIPILLFLTFPQLLLPPPHYFMAFWSLSSLTFFSSACFPISTSPKLFPSSVLHSPLVFACSSAVVPKTSRVSTPLLPQISAIFHAGWCMIGSIQTVPAWLFRIFGCHWLVQEWAKPEYLWWESTQVYHFWIPSSFSFLSSSLLVPSSAMWFLSYPILFSR